MSNARSFLFPFRYSNKVAYVVEFSHRKIRLYAKKSLVTTFGVETTDEGIESRADFSSYPPLEIESPYSFDDLWDSEELCCKIQTIQHSDVLYIFNEKYPIMTLKRYSNIDWRLEELELKNGPFLAMNTGDILIKCDENLNDETQLTASDELFVETDVGRLIRLRIYDDDTLPWASNISVEKDAIYRSDNKYYLALDAGTTGTVKPVHSEGTRSDGKVRWKFLHDGLGVVKISEFIDAKNVKAKVCKRLPEAIREGTLYWEFGMLHAGSSYPISGAFFRNRFAFLINTETGPNVCLSCIGDYNNFEDMEFGEATAETAITVPVLNTEFNEGKWLYSGDVLFVGTGASEFYIDSLAQNSAMAGDNIKISQISSVGSKAIKPVGVGGHVFFVDRYGLGIRDLVYNYYNDGYDPIDISLLGKHLFKSRIIDIAYQETPDKIIWCLMGDGSLSAITFLAEQEVVAFSRHDFSGNAESIAVIPNFEECYDEVWLEISRVIENANLRTVECLELGMPRTSLEHNGVLHDEDLLQLEYVQNNAMYLDGAIKFERNIDDDSLEISGLSHLNGKLVSIFADGEVVPSQLVIDGKVKLSSCFAKALVGLAITSQYIPQPTVISSQFGHGLGDKHRISRVKLLLYLSGGGQVGETLDKLSDILYRNTDMSMGKVQELYSGYIDVLINSSTSSDERMATFVLQSETPLPLNVLGVVPSID